MTQHHETLRHPAVWAAGAIAFAFDLVWLWATTRNLSEDLASNWLGLVIALGCYPITASTGFVLILLIPSSPAGRGLLIGTLVAIAGLALLLL